ncbi:hypothetical protein S40288_06891 [Stachybotrys chartarum IBT 40288]|nr:hypothetical protein S40288_06891 [Stachybotrys chartarum IBT 40288]
MTVEAPAHDKPLSEVTPLLVKPKCDDDESNEKSAQRAISSLQAVAVGCGIWIMILLQSSNISGMTMIQGSIAEDFHMHDNPMWLSTSFIIPVSALAPFISRLAATFSPRAVITPMVTCVAAGSLISGLATSLNTFLIGRVISGIGYAGVLPLSVVFIIEFTTGKSRGIFVGMFNTGATIGVSVGAALFGALLPMIGWRPLFWIQAPLILFSGVGTYRSLPTDEEPGAETTRQKARRVDYLGAILLTTTIVLFLYGLAGEIKRVPLLQSLISLIAFLVVERFFAAEPIIPLNVLLSKDVMLICFSQLGFMSTRWLVIFYAPIFMLAVGGAAPTTAGTIIIPTNLGFAIGGISIGCLHVRRSGSFWRPSVVAITGFSITVFLLAAISKTQVSVSAFVIVVFANGFATGATLNYTLAHLLYCTPDRNSQYVATSLVSTFRSFAGSFGATIGGGAFYSLLGTGLREGFLEVDGGLELSPSREKLIARLLTSPALVFNSGLNPQDQEVAAEGYAEAIKGLWQVAALLTVFVLIMQALTSRDRISKVSVEVVHQEQEQE